MVASSPSNSDQPPRVWCSVFGVEVTTRRIVVTAAILVAVAAIGIGWRQVDVDAIHAQAEKLPAWGVTAVIAAAPLLGVPVAMLHVVAGVRFGVWSGLVVVALTTVFHHAAGYALVKFAPHVFADKLQGWRARFPSGAHVPVTIFSCVLPGMPYAVQLYLLPVIGVPLRILLLVSAPLHTLRAVISIVGGHVSADLTPGKIAGMLAYYVVLTAACALTFRRLRTLLRHP